MAKKDPAKNPALDVEVQDLFEKDLKDITDEDWNRAVKYYTDLRVAWSKREDKKKAKENETPATIEELENLTL